LKADSKNLLDQRQSNQVNLLLSVQFKYVRWL